MKQKFQEKRFNEVQLSLVELCNQIIANYDRQGFTLSLRQLYYQLVTLNAIPNRVEAYTMVGKLVTDARMAGLIDWDAIVDRGRPLHKNTAWNHASDALDALSVTFMLNRWRTQPTFIEVMVEKQALEGVLLPVCARLGIGFTANKGYSSSTALYEASQRYLKAISRQKTVCVLYLGDHDPSGCDMTRDIRERLAVFCGQPVDVKRLALNKSQIEEHHLPPNPAKLSDSRAGEYVEKHGESSWELDAIPPTILANYVTAAVKRRLDLPAWEAAARREVQARAMLKAAADTLRKVERDTDGPDKTAIPG